jgi:hypothetical protein
MVGACGTGSVPSVAAHCGMHTPTAAVLCSALWNTHTNSCSGYAAHCGIHTPTAAVLSMQRIVECTHQQLQCFAVHCGMYTPTAAVLCMICLLSGTTLLAAHCCVGVPSTNTFHDDGLLTVGHIRLCSCCSLSPMPSPSWYIIDMSWVLKTELVVVCD